MVKNSIKIQHSIVKAFLPHININFNSQMLSNQKNSIKNDNRCFKRTLKYRPQDIPRDYLL